jgi:hypothetical protein
MVWIKILAILVTVLIAVWATLAAVGQWRWHALTAELLSDLVAAQTPLMKRRYDPADLSALPPPVQRYLQAVLTAGQSIVTKVDFTHQGTFNIGEVTDNWKPFTSSQVVVTHRPGFVWDGTVSMAPGVPVRVHDAYVAGEGQLVPAIFGLFKLAELRGRGDIATGELLRYLAETPWYPTALLPGQGVIWTPISDSSALATLTDGDVSVSLTFQFGADNLIASVRAEARGRTVGRVIIPTPWQGRWSEYQRREGMLVPTVGEVAWLLPQGDKSYWRGTITSLHYDMLN